jgi:hypothetical protein
MRANISIFYHSQPIFKVKYFHNPFFKKILRNKHIPEFFIAV